MSVDEEKKIIHCDFCANFIRRADVEKINNGGGWSWGQRGFTRSAGIVCYMHPEIKHSCPNVMCLEKLKLWARS